MKADDVRAFSEQAAAVGEGLWPGVVRINGGEPVAAAVTEPRAGLVLIEGGDTESAELVVRIRKVVLETPPEREAVLEWKKAGETGWRTPKWRVTEVGGNGVDACWVIRAVARN